MAKQDYVFEGKAAWVSKKPNKWGKFSLNFYPDDAAGRKAVKDTGIKNKVQEDDGSKSGVEGLYYTLRSTSPYPILDTSGNEVEGMIGNGSRIQVHLMVETFDSKEHGPQARSELSHVVVTDLIPYEPKTDTDNQAELPA